jgi:hypothetical protein
MDKEHPNIQNHKNLVEHYKGFIKTLKAKEGDKESFEKLKLAFEALLVDFSALGSTIEARQVKPYATFSEDSGIEAARQRISEGLMSDILDSSTSPNKKEKLYKKNFLLFSTIFPDNETCCDYLAEYKWKEGFRCQRCDNEKYCSGQGYLARRCTKCAYNESATALTLYQGCKIDLNKAFYMTYIICAKNKNVSSYELAEALDTEQKTCWKFKQKILGALSTRNANGDNGWEFLEYNYLMHYYFSKLSLSRA